MIGQKFLYRFSISIIIISLVFGIAGYFKIQYQFYLWEIFIDAKILTVIGILFLLFQRKMLIITSNGLSVLRFDWKRNVLYFFFPTLLYGISIVTGMLFTLTSMNILDNAPTLVLATIFDIPALYVFSATTVLIEEIVFRGILISSFQQTNTKFLSNIISSSLWTVFFGNEILGIDEIDIVTIITLLFFFMSLSMFLSVLVQWSRSIWPGYSFRIGIITLTPIMLTSKIVESDPFFATRSIVFISEGLIVSILLCGMSIILSRGKTRIPENSQK